MPELHEYPNRYAITLSGCDDATTFCAFLDVDSLRVVEHLAKASEEVSRYGCMPVLAVHKSTERDERDYLEALAEKAEDEAGEPA